MEGRPLAVVRIAVSDMAWFTPFAASVLDLLLEVEGEDILVTDEMKRAAERVRELAGGTFPRRS